MIDTEEVLVSLKAENDTKIQGKQYIPKVKYLLTLRERFLRTEG